MQEQKERQRQKQQEREARQAAAEVQTPSEEEFLDNPLPGPAIRSPDQRRLRNATANIMQRLRMQRAKEHEEYEMGTEESREDLRHDDEQWE